MLLREGGPIGIHCTATVRRWLNDSLPLEPILACFSRPVWNELPLDRSVELRLQDGAPSGLRIRAFEVDRHVPRFVREGPASAVGSVIGLQVEDIRTGAQLVHAPCVASLGGQLQDTVREVDCLLLDGTFWEDEEPIRCGIGSRTARAMGHLPVSGQGGSLDWLSALKVRHRVYVHINNTNPMLNESGSEYFQVTGQGVRVGADGDHWEL
jgi:pyrroloquinoline quinone biosynthesis protein B